MSWLVGAVICAGVGLACGDGTTTLPTFQIVCEDTLAPGFRRSNRIVWVQTAFGTLGVLSCLSAVLVIFAYRKDTVYLRERILAGLFVANIFYSAADMVPTNVIATSGADCGQYMVGNPGHGAGSVTGECTPQSFFFFGLYTTAGFELFMLAASISALLKASINPLSQRAEALGFVLCFAIGGIGSCAFYLECAAIVSETDDDGQDDDKVENGQYNQIFTDHVFGALSLVGVSLILWLYQRWLLSQLFDRLREARERPLLPGEGPSLASDPFGARRTQLKPRMLADREASYRQMTRPLEPFIVVIVLFGVPMLVMISSSCLGETLQFQTGQSNRPPCLFVAFMVLSPRSFSLAAIYFLDRTCRCQLCDVGGLLRRLKARWLRCSGSPHPGAVRFENQSQSVGFVRRHPQDLVVGDPVPTEEDYRRANTMDLLMGIEASRVLHELDTASEETGWDTAAASNAGSTAGPGGHASNAPYARMDD